MQHRHSRTPSSSSLSTSPSEALLRNILVQRSASDQQVGHCSRAAKQGMNPYSARVRPRRAASTPAPRPRSPARSHGHHQQQLGRRSLSSPDPYQHLDPHAYPSPLADDDEDEDYDEDEECLVTPPQTPPTARSMNPSRRPTFDVREASTRCRAMAGYVSFAAVEGLGVPPEWEEDDGDGDERKKGKEGWRWRSLRVFGERDRGSEGGQ